MKRLAFLIALLTLTSGCFFDDPNSTVNLDDAKIALLVVIGPDELADYVADGTTPDISAALPLAVTSGNCAAAGAMSQTLYVANIGTYTAKSLSVDDFVDTKFSFVGGSYPGTGAGVTYPECTDTLAANEVCELMVQYDPSDGVTYATDLILNYIDGYQHTNVTRSLEGSCAP